MNASSLRLNALAVLPAAVGFAVSLAECASTVDIVPQGDSTLDDVLSRGPIASSDRSLALPIQGRQIELSDHRLAVASIR